MMYTEEQARERWCPAARAVTWEYQNVKQGRAGTFNRPFESGLSEPEDCRCIASDCMWWRWEDGNVAIGYCGQAGKP